MVKSTKRRYTIADWRKDNPVESDIMDLICAANSFASGQIPHAENVEDPSGTPESCVDTATELELAISRASLAIRAMLNTREGRKAAGLKPKHRGKEHDPEKTNRSDPQVQKLRCSFVRTSEGSGLVGIADPNLLHAEVKERRVEGK